MNSESGTSEITYVTTYYNDPTLLYALLENFNTETFSNIIIVDDGSQESPAEPVVQMFPDLPVSLFRIKDDLGFNSHGARNLAMKHVKTEWALLTDIDMYYDEGICYDLKHNIQHASNKQYFNFWVNSKQDFIGRCQLTHNDFCIRVEDFWQSGGYDEEFVGMHYGDRIFVDRLNSYLKRTTMPNIVIDKRMGRNTIMTDKVEKTTYVDEGNKLLHPLINKDKLTRLLKIVGNRNENREQWQRNNIIQFEWEQLI